MAVNENTPLLQKHKTPLPKFQLCLVLLLMFAEPISAQYIYPFINQVSRWNTYGPFVTDDTFHLLSVLYS